MLKLRIKTSKDKNSKKLIKNKNMGIINMNFKTNQNSEYITIPISNYICNNINIFWSGFQ